MSAPISNDGDGVVNAPPVVNNAPPTRGPAGEVLPGVTPIGAMTDREIAEESLLWIRLAGKAMVEMQSGGMGKLLGAVLTRKG